MNQTPTTLIHSAFALVAGWENRRVPRTKWHQADALMMQAALLDADKSMAAWEQLALQYDHYLQSQVAQRRAA